MDTDLFLAERYIHEARQFNRSKNPRQALTRLTQASILLFQQRLRIEEETLTDLCCQALRSRAKRLS